MNQIKYTAPDNLIRLIAQPNTAPLLFIDTDATNHQP